VEVSGRGGLAYAGAADAGASAGKSGTLLLDPKNIVISDAPAGVFPQFNFIDPHPTSGGRFGYTASVLGSGKVVVTNPADNFGGSGAGAAYLFNGLTGALLSSLVGTNPNAGVGAGFVTALSNGNYVIASLDWNGGRGAVTWGSGTAGVSGILDASNSLVGSNPDDQVGGYFECHPAGLGCRVVGGVTALSNGNYVVASRLWNGSRGAATWGNGSTAITGTVSEANSLISSYPGDQVAGSTFGIVPLSNGNYVVNTPAWNRNRGASTWGNGSTGISGIISDANSLVGSQPGDLVGFVIPLRNGNYVVSSPSWNGQRGAVTWSNGSTGISGTVSDANSLVGSHPGLVGSHPGDEVGKYIAALNNGNYVVQSPLWNNGGGPNGRGAVTWGNGSTGVSGTVSEANSLIGSNPNDLVGLGLIPLSNGNYVVDSPHWHDNRGAATWGNGSTAITGTVSDANSLVGSNSGDKVGAFLTPLSNGNYVVQSPFWNGGRGAVTWGSGTAGVSGPVSEANSVIGQNYMDPAVTPLRNGNYVVSNTGWNGGRGVATWMSGTTGQTLDGANSITPQNSLVGMAPEAGLSVVIRDNPVSQTFLAAFVTEGGGRVTAGLVEPSQLPYAIGQSQTLAITPAFLTRTLNTGTAVDPSTWVGAR